MLSRMADQMERLAVGLSHDSGWSPRDIVPVRRADVELGKIAIMRKVRQKTRVVAEAVLE